MTPIKLSLSILIATLTACSTIPEPVPPPDITEERLHLHLADECNIVKEPGGLYLKCGEEGMFAVGDNCEIKLEKDGKYLDCSE